MNCDYDHIDRTFFFDLVVKVVFVREDLFSLVKKL